MTRVSIALAALGVALMSATAAAQDNATQTVTLEVTAINEIALSTDGPVSLTINTATAGSQPTAATSVGLTWDITTNETNKKVTGEVDLAVPTNTTLELELAAPTGATSTGATVLTTTPAELVTGITEVAESGLAMTYTFSVTSVTAGVIAATDRDVTLTIVDTT